MRINVTRILSNAQKNVNITSFIADKFTVATAVRHLVMKQPLNKGHHCTEPNYLFDSHVTDVGSRSPLRSLFEFREVAARLIPSAWGNYALHL